MERESVEVVRRRFRELVESSELSKRAERKAPTRCMGVESGPCSLNKYGFVLVRSCNVSRFHTIT